MTAAAVVTPVRSGYLKRSDLGNPELSARRRRRNLNIRRDWARSVELPIVQLVLEPMSNDALADHFGLEGDHAGAQLRSGAKAATAGELAFLLPVVPAVLSLVGLIRERVGREIRDGGLPSRDPMQTNLRLMLTHLDAVEVLVSAR